MCDVVGGLSHLECSVAQWPPSVAAKGDFPDFSFCKPCCVGFPDLRTSLHVFIEEKAEMESPGQSMCRVLLARRGLTLVCPDTSGENLEAMGIHPRPWWSYGAGTRGAGTLKALPRPLSLLLWSPAAVQGCPALPSRGPIPHTAGCFTARFISTFWNRAQPVVSKERRQAEKGEVFQVSFTTHFLSATLQTFTG